jgi:hypothetical protein
MKTLLIAVAVLAASTAMFTQQPPPAAPASSQEINSNGITRTVLGTFDFPPGYQTILTIGQSRRTLALSDTRISVLKLAMSWKGKML